MSFSDEKNLRQVICKASRDGLLIKDEVKRHKKAMSYSSYSQFLSPLGDVQELDTDPKVTAVSLATIDGVTLEAHLTNLLETDANPSERALPIISLLTAMTEKAAANVQPLAPSIMALSADDVWRFEAALPYLKRLVRGFTARGGTLPPVVTNEACVDSFLAHVIRDWNTIVRSQLGTEVAHYPQHGDLNPRNVLVGKDGRLSLIDFARFEFWPAGYDLIRFELQLILRTLSAFDEGDSFPDDFVAWWRLWTSFREPKKALSFDSARKDMAVVAALLDVIRLSRENVWAAVGWNIDVGLRATNLVRCYDAIKMCSYQDASPFKRLLFFSIALSCASDSGLIRP